MEGRWHYETRGAGGGGGVSVSRDPPRQASELVFFPDDEGVMVIAHETVPEISSLRPGTCGPKSRKSAKGHEKGEESK